MNGSPGKKTQGLSLDPVGPSSRSRYPTLNADVHEMIFAGLLRLFGALWLCAVLGVVLAPQVAARALCPNEALRAEGSSSSLPDCRVSELVSPPQKNGAEVYPLGRAHVIQAAEDGGAITYQVNNPIEANPAGNAEEDRVLSSRDAGGWSSTDISTSHQAPTGASVSAPEFFTFSSDLTSSTVQLRSPEYQDVREPLYSRNNGTGTYEPLVTPVNVASAAKQSVEEHGALGGTIKGTTPDGSHVVFFSPEDLTGNTPEGGLFEWSSGSLQLVSMLPEGSSVSTQVLGGGREARDVRHAISEDGSRVFWETPPGRSELRKQAVSSRYSDRCNGADRCAPGRGGRRGRNLTRRWMVPNGQQQRFGGVLREREVADLRRHCGGQQDYDLYAYDVEAPEGHRLTDLTVDTRAENTPTSRAPCWEPAKTARMFTSRRRACSRLARAPGPAKKKNLVRRATCM